MRTFAPTHRKPLTAQLALAPLCGLLATCALFLFITARFEVWMSMPSVATWPAARTSAALERERDLRVYLSARGFSVRVAGERHPIARRAGQLDLDALCTRARRELAHRPDIRVVRLIPDDGTPFAELVASYDALLARHCPRAADSYKDRH